VKKAMIRPVTLVAVVVSALLFSVRVFVGQEGANYSAPRLDAWRILGPGGGGAQFYPAISPHDPRLVLVACDMTGAYISEDAGNSCSYPCKCLKAKPLWRAPKRSASGKPSLTARY
jgi:hypothetical protein